MTALIMDGFDHYGPGAAGAAQMLAGVWAQLGGQIGVPSFGARTGPYAFKNAPDSLGGRIVLPATESDLFIRHGFGVEALPEANNLQEIVSWHDNTNTVIATLFCQSTGTIELVSAAGASLAITQGPVIVAGNWHFLEYEFARSAGNFTLRIDDATASGTPAIAATGLSLGAKDPAQLDFLDTTSEFITTCWMDDLMINNSSGTVNNGFLGDRRIALLLADADVLANQGWSPRFYQKIGLGILNNTDTHSGQLNTGLSAAGASSFEMGAGDYTLESFVRFEALPSGSHRAVVFGAWDETNNARSYQFYLGSQALNSSQLALRISTDGTAATVSEILAYPFSPELDTWYHVAVVRASAELLLFVNGEQLGLPIADANAYFASTQTPAAVGAQGEFTGTHMVANTQLQGWFDETRITVGYARYTSNFTPTTVEFPRSVAGDPHFANVVLLMGYDSILQDESSFHQGLNVWGTPCVQQSVNDGPLVGNFSTIGKASPDDNTFMEAPFLPATGVLSLASLPTAGKVVTVGTTDGTAAAVYTWRAAVASAFDVLIDTTIAQSLQNLQNAINAGAGAGTKYGTGTTSNFDVTASTLPAGQMEVTANRPGTAGNAIVSTTNVIGAAWGGATLAGGTDIPGPVDFKVQRPPPMTTLISAVQIAARTFKSDAGVGTFKTSFIGPLGTVDTGPSHSLTVSPVYYNDIYETDPDTSAPISPATLINGSIRLNRVT